MTADETYSLHGHLDWSYIYHENEQVWNINKLSYSPYFNLLFLYLQIDRQLVSLYIAILSDTKKIELAFHNKL